jgi:hypothetical protein
LFVYSHIVDGISVPHRKDLPVVVSPDFSHEFENGSIVIHNCDTRH